MKASKIKMPRFQSALCPQCGGTGGTGVTALFCKTFIGKAQVEHYG
ncbi:hypothetical protein KX147_002216 [Salmonella enterica]|nr:hypothetical protein [Salmonella enterica]